MMQASVERAEQTGPAEKKRVAPVPQREQLTRMPEASCQKEQSYQSRSQDREMRERKRVKVRVAPRQEKGGSEQECGEVRVCSIVKKRGFQGGEVGQAKRAFLEVGESMSRPKILQKNLESLGFTPSLAKSEIEKVVEKRGLLIRRQGEMGRGDTKRGLGCLREKCDWGGR